MTPPKYKQLKINRINKAAINASTPTRPKSQRSKQTQGRVCVDAHDEQN